MIPMVGPEGPYYITSHDQFAFPWLWQSPYEGLRHKYGLEEENMEAWSTLFGTGPSANNTELGGGAIWGNWCATLQARPFKLKLNAKVCALE